MKLTGWDVRARHDGCLFQLCKPVHDIRYGRSGADSNDLYNQLLHVRLDTHLVSCGNESVYSSVGGRFFGQRQRYRRETALTSGSDAHPLAEHPHLRRTGAAGLRGH